MTKPGHDRRAARALGIRSEQVAEWLLRLKMFRILARNYRVRDGEIDVIARRGTLVVFVEVKARPTLLDGMESIGRRKQMRMARASRHWIASHPALAGCSFRADGIFTRPRRLPHHVPGLFELDIG